MANKTSKKRGGSKAVAGSEPWGTTSQDNMNHPAQSKTAASTTTEDSMTTTTEQNESAIDGMVTLTKRNVQKNGIVTYARDGVNASVYFNKSMFNGEPPDSVSIGAVNLRAPGEGAVGGGRTVSPEVLAKKSAEADRLAEKAKVRAEKALAKANKLKARVGGVQAPAAEGAETAAAETV